MKFFCETAEVKIAQRSNRWGSIDSSTRTEHQDFGGDQHTHTLHASSKTLKKRKRESDNAEERDNRPPIIRSATDPAKPGPG